MVRVEDMREWYGLGVARVVRLPIVVQGDEVEVVIM